MKKSQAYKCLMAKTDPDNSNLWLPLWMHLRDTAGVMKRLVSKWIPEATINATGLSWGEFNQVSVFMAAIHDIGKATSFFQSIISNDSFEKKCDIENNGFTILDGYIASGKTPHAHAGQWILQSNTTQLCTREDVSCIVGSHHGKPLSSGNIFGEEDMIKVYPNNFYGTEIDDNKKQIWQVTWQKIVNNGLEIAGLHSVEKIPELKLQAQVLISGLLIVADWIASNTSYFPLISMNEYGTEDKYPQRVKTGWAKVRLSHDWESEICQMDEMEFKDRFEFYPNEVQKTMYETINQCESPGIFVLEAQMGVGKTEAALSGAEVLAARRKNGGIFFGLPTQATCNGLFNRLLSWAEQVSGTTATSIRLAHNAAEMNDEYNRLLMQGKSYVDAVEDDANVEKRNVEVHPWFQGNKKALLADFVLGTVDQFLMASLKRKHFMLRHVGLAGKVVIIDECHAYDTYMNQYLERSLQWMASYGVPVILLSATLPSERRCALIRSYAQAYSKYYLHNKQMRDDSSDTPCWEENNGYPLLTWTDGNRICQRTVQQSVQKRMVEIENKFCIEEMVDEIDISLVEGGCACIIVNTVKKAQEIYAYVKENVSNAEIILYHSQYIMPDRMEKEKYVLSQMGKQSNHIDGHRFIVIGTQVLEQSLDYDADIMVTQLCPIDLLLQRIGRLHRHTRRRPRLLQTARCIILHEQEESYDAGTDNIYGKYLLERTECILPQQVTIPEDIPKLVQRVYDENDSLEMEHCIHEENKIDFNIKTMNKKEKAKNYLLEKPYRSNMKDMLNNSYEGCRETVAEAGVRDGASSLEVLIMKQGGDGRIYFVGEKKSDEISFSHDYVPNNYEGRQIAMQRLKMPHIFCVDWTINSTIEKLESDNQNKLPLWQQSPWIKGELILLLDSNQEADFMGYKLSYTWESGLQYCKIQERNGGE